MDWPSQMALKSPALPKQVLSNLRLTVKLWNLNNPGFFEHGMSAALVNGFDGSRRENKSNSFLEFRHVNAFFLKVRVLANRPGRVKLGSTSTIRISASHLGTFLIYGANSRHLRQLT